MNCCVNCFKDPEIIAIITGLDENGNCDYCGSTDIYIYNIERNSILSELLDGFLDIYSPEKLLPKSFPKKKLNLLKDILTNEWDIFKLDSENIYTLITEICAEKYQERPEIFDTPVGIKEMNEKEYLERNSILKVFEWEDFIKDIKSANRFHTNHINKSILLLFFEYVIKTYKSGKIFYRGRISPNSRGLKITEMGAPPVGSATAGRANPEGISCLYLAESEKTTLHEIRAGVFDYVTIGEFELLQDIKVINLASIDKISPFLEIDYIQHAVNKHHLRKISKEIAKPLRKQDSNLDYLPAQYISDFIKSQGYDGVEYASTMVPGGYNLAIFNENLFKCNSVKVYDVKSVIYDYAII